MKQLASGILVITVFILSAAHVRGDHGLTRDGCTPPKEKSLPVKLRMQERTSWCSIASAQMIMDFYDRFYDQNQRQCVLATTAQRNTFGGDALDALVVGVDRNADGSFVTEWDKQSCCNNDEKHAPVPCWAESWPEWDFVPYGLHYEEFWPTLKDPALPWEDVKDQIFCKGRPFLFVWGTKVQEKNELGELVEFVVPEHALVAKGYEESLDGRFVIAFDPLIPPDPKIPNHDGSRYLSYEDEFVPGQLPGQSHFEDYVELYRN